MTAHRVCEGTPPGTRVHRREETCYWQIDVQKEKNKQL